MTQTDCHFDVLVLGQHPAACLAAALLTSTGTLRVAQVRLLPRHPLDRLVVINPALFELHKLLSPLRRKLDLLAIYGIRFVGELPDQHSEYHDRSAVAYVASYAQVAQAMLQIAIDQGVHVIQRPADPVHLAAPDEQGVSVTLGRHVIRARVLIVGDHLDADVLRAAGVPEQWDPTLLYRQSLVRLPASSMVSPAARPVIPMLLDLRGELDWAWLLPGPHDVQLAVQQPASSAPRDEPHVLLRHWVQVLVRHRILSDARRLDLTSAWSMTVPLAGALEQEPIGDRTLLVGPAGGFYSGCGEDIYPNCWSAIYAADVVRKALKEKHVQDALQAYRHRWRTTLGEYLRGPQQNLRFLLPLVYRNPVMTTRLAEAILLGKNVVR
jgi:flavin-dependent dehydrogenase